MTEKLKVIAITGATATGKTKYAVELAQKINGEIISADSRMVYKYFDIATAKPDKPERGGIPHYLIDILEPTEEFSVAEFVDKSSELIKIISEKGKTPIIVGGTGLYFKVLCENYSLPRVCANEELRTELENFAKENGREKLHEILQKLDYETSLKIHPNNLVRVIRTIEIIKTLNQPLSKLNRKNFEQEFEIDFLGLDISDREVLYEKINNRVDIMVKKGLLNEAKKLYEKYGKIKSLANTIGYQELIPYFDGNSDLLSAIDKIKQNTRNYAKRQLSLLRTLKKIKWINTN